MTSPIVRVHIISYACFTTCALSLCYRDRGLHRDAVSEWPGSNFIPRVSTNAGTVVSVSAMPDAITGIWELNIQIPANTPAGGIQLSLTAGGVPVRDANLVVWVQ